MMGVQLDDYLSVSSFAENGRWKPTEGAPGGGGWKLKWGIHLKLHSGQEQTQLIMILHVSVSGLHMSRSAIRRR